VVAGFTSDELHAVKPTCPLACRVRLISATVCTSGVAWHDSTQHVTTGIQSQRVDRVPRARRVAGDCRRIEVATLGYHSGLNCKDKDRLPAEYNRCVQESSRAVQRLSAKAGTGQGTHSLLLRQVEEARVKTQLAKAVYEKHVEEHDCRHLTENPCPIRPDE
jgi:hypothetical protein